jgi:hypothetical protein
MVHLISSCGLMLAVVVIYLDLIVSRKGGREKGSTACTAVEHVALLFIISEVPDAFNASESSLQWEAVCK